MCERSGVVNIGIEGMMLAAAFIGWVVGVCLVGRRSGRSAAADLRASRRRSLMAVAAAVARRHARSRSLHAWLSISVRADQIISGTIINIVAFGHHRLPQQPDLARPSPVGAGSFKPLRRRPTSWSTCRSSAGSSTRSSARDRSRCRSSSSSSSFQIMLFRSRWGLRSRAVGEHPRAAETVGIDVIRLRYRNVLAGRRPGRPGRRLPEHGARHPSSPT